MHEEVIKQFTEERKRRKVSQEVVAKYADVSEFTISRMENGKASPMLKTFCEMAKGIGMMVVLVPIPLKEKLPNPKPIEEEEDVYQDPDYSNWDYDEEDGS